MISDTVKTAIEKVDSAQTEAELESIRVAYLGRNGIVTAQLRSVGALPPQERKKAGAAANEVRLAIEAALAVRMHAVRSSRIEQAISQDTLDITAPAKFTSAGNGHTHPVLTLIDDIVRVFWQMGYQIVDGPEVDTEWNVFEALNIPKDHPARDMQDTFYLKDGSVPRTHTSNVQIRHMEQNEPPIRIISIGKVYRNEDEDTRHVWMFHQVEGLVVDKGITLADLKGTLLAMMKGLLGEDTKVKLLPNFFPYTEPSVELHATCPSCKGSGCRMCSGTGWLELGGAGMVHPQVLRNVGIDPHVYSGFAFGFGPERIAAIRHGVPDVRVFWRPDLRFLENF